MAGMLKERGLTPTERPKAPRLQNLSSDLRESVSDLYRSLGGQQDQPIFRPGSWDLSLGGVLIELDEDLHYNRYRETTLAPDWAATLPWTPTYVGHCQVCETECLRAGKWGKRWTNASSARMFSEGSPPGDLSDKGSPRWKQRALYDALKDAFAVQSGTVRVARLSVDDGINGTRLGDALEQRAGLDLDGLLELLETRTC